MRGRQVGCRMPTRCRMQDGGAEAAAAAQSSSNPGVASSPTTTIWVAPVNSRVATSRVAWLAGLARASPAKAARISSAMRAIALLAGQVPEHCRDLGQRAVGRRGRPVMGVLRPHDRPIRRGGAEEEAAVRAVVEVRAGSAATQARA